MAVDFLFISSEKRRWSMPASLECVEVVGETLVPIDPEYPTLQWLLQTTDNAIFEDVSRCIQGCEFEPPKACDYDIEWHMNPVYKDDKIAPEHGCDSKFSNQEIEWHTNPLYIEDTEVNHENGFGSKDSSKHNDCPTIPLFQDDEVAQGNGCELKANCCGRGAAVSDTESVPAVSMASSDAVTPPDTLAAAPAPVFPAQKEASSSSYAVPAVVHCSGPAATGVRLVRPTLDWEEFVRSMEGQEGLADETMVEEDEEIPWALRPLKPCSRPSLALDELLASLDDQVGLTDELEDVKEEEEEMEVPLRLRPEMPCSRPSLGSGSLLALLAGQEGLTDGLEEEEPAAPFTREEVHCPFPPVPAALSPGAAAVPAAPTKHGCSLPLASVQPPERSRNLKKLQQQQKQTMAAASSSSTTLARGKGPRKAASPPSGKKPAWNGSNSINSRRVVGGMSARTAPACKNQNQNHRRARA